MNTVQPATETWLNQEKHGAAKSKEDATNVK
jgi:hypothetical protein